MALKIKKLLQLFCVSKKDPKKKGDAPFPHVQKNYLFC
jgi:hypothetical protein